MSDSIPIFLDFPDEIGLKRYGESLVSSFDSSFGSASNTNGLFLNPFDFATRRSPAPRPSQGALEGIKILDFSRLISGPFATMILSDMGAEVWKIERPGTGDESRAYKPPAVEGESCYFMAFNRNKKSIVVDLKKPEGKEIISELVKRADVLVENFLPNTMERIGLGWKDVHQLNPRLIYCSISGYGSTGPWSHRGGYDVIAAALGGYLSVTGPKGGEPVKSGLAVTDMLTAMYAHGAILAALFQRLHTGMGQKIECNLLSTQVSALSNIANGYLNTGHDPIRRGTDHETIVPYSGFCCSDGKWLIVGAGNDRQWKEFCTVIGLKELADNSLFRSNPDRVKHRDLLMEILEARFLSKTSAEWSSIFDKTTLPYGPINNMEDTFRHPQVIHNQLLKTVDHPTAGEVKVTGPAVKFSECENHIRSAPPVLGQHTSQVLRDVLHKTEDEIEQLKEAHAIDTWEPTDVTIKN